MSDSIIEEVRDIREQHAANLEMIRKELAR